MSESTISVLIAAGILIALALFVPCMESISTLVRRRPRKPSAAGEQQMV